MEVRKKSLVVAICKGLTTGYFPQLIEFCFVFLSSPMNPKQDTQKEIYTNTRNRKPVDAKGKEKKSNNSHRKIIK